MTSDLFAEFVKLMRGACVGALLTLRVDAEPAPESLRINTRTGRVFPGKNYAIFKAECIKQLAMLHNEPPVLGPLVFAVESIRAKPKTTKREWPTGDFDNLAKGPADAVTQTDIWNDDDQVLAGLSVKRYACLGETPGVNIIIGKLKA